MFGQLALRLAQTVSLILGLMLVKTGVDYQSWDKIRKIFSGIYVEQLLDDNKLGLQIGVSCLGHLYIVIG